MNGTNPTQTPTHFPPSGIRAQDQKSAMAMLNIYACWISMGFGFIQLYVQCIKKKKKKKKKFQSSYLKVRVSQRGCKGSGAATWTFWHQRGASQATSKQPSPSLLRITVEQNQFLNVFIWSLLLSWLLWGWWESGRTESCWDIWLFIFLALRVLTLHQPSRLCSISLLRAEAKGDRRLGVGGGRNPHCCLGRGEPPPIPHRAPGVLPIEVTFPTWTSPPQWWGGGGECS